MSDTQMETLVVIDAFTKANGCAPTRQEVAVMRGMKSANSIQRHIDILKGKGYVTTFGNAARGTSITTKGKTALTKFKNNRKSAS